MQIDTVAVFYPMLIIDLRITSMNYFQIYVMSENDPNNHDRLQIGAKIFES